MSITISPLQRQLPAVPDARSPFSLISFGRARPTRSPIHLTRLCCQRIGRRPSRRLVVVAPNKGAHQERRAQSAGVPPIRHRCEMELLGAPFLQTSRVERLHSTKLVPVPSFDPEDGMDVTRTHCHCRRLDRLLLQWLLVFHQGTTVMNMMKATPVTTAHHTADKAVHRHLSASSTTAS